MSIYRLKILLSCFVWYEEKPTNDVTIDDYCLHECALLLADHNGCPED